MKVYLAKNDRWMDLPEFAGGTWLNSGIPWAERPLQIERLDDFQDMAGWRDGDGFGDGLGHGFGYGDVADPLVIAHGVPALSTLTA